MPPLVRNRAVILLWLWALGSGQSALAAGFEEAPFFETTTVFPTAPGNKPNHRIPALIQMPGGDLLAFAEKRNDGIGDVGNHDLVLKRSADLGQTWSDEQLIFDDGPNTCTDTTLCFDRQRNRLFLFFLRDKKEFGYLRSDDEGRTSPIPRSPSGRRNTPAAATT